MPVYRVVTRDNAEYLLGAETDAIMHDWVTKISFHAQLPPAMQLLSYDVHKVRSHAYKLRSHAHEVRSHAH